MFSFSSGDCRHLIVFDLEWNQSSYNPNHRMPHEIIEIGACRVDQAYQVVDTFSRLIRPRLYKRLDKHIKKVTGMTEAELEAGGTFADVFADFIAWCGEDMQLVTWGRDDFPVLRRNAAFHQTQLPFEPPIDAQLVFGGACLGATHQQMNLHAAMEHQNIVIDVPAHRAVYDAQCTAALLSSIDEAANALDENRKEQLARAIAREKRIAASTLVSLPTRHEYQTDALADGRLMAIACPKCGARTRFDTPWFDSGREKYMALSVCPAHGFCYGQMHFKRGTNGLLITHQRIYIAAQDEIDDVRERYRLYQITPPRKRHHRLNMEDSVRRAGSADKQTGGN
ncbi:MAG: exonuclease domain-containing protein [Clostridia bacterium]|nr:exonuclease domain-containing protein [Clostridia bacterium]